MKYPTFKGGKEALEKFVKEHLKYPEAALENKIEGTVEVAYTVNGLGKVVDAKIIEGLGYGCDEEAIRLVKLLPYQKAVNRGFKTTSNKKIKIHFKLPRKTQHATLGGVAYNYQVVPQKKPVKPANPPKPGKTYTIQVNIKRK